VQDDLIRRAALAGARHHRSAAQQIEYWAALGQDVAALLDTDLLLGCEGRTGTAAGGTGAGGGGGSGERVRFP